MTDARNRLTNLLTQSLPRLWRHWSMRKLANYLTVEADLRRRRIRCHGLPYQICIEVANVCNTRCRLCPIGMGFRPREKLGFMDVSVFESTIRSIAWHTHSLGLYNWGEPLLHPHIFDMVRFAKSQGMLTHISSNMHYLKGDHVSELVDSGLELLIVSIHAMTQTSYESYQPKMSIGEPLEAIRQIMEYKRRVKKSTPDVQLHFVVHRKNEAEIPLLAQFARENDLDFALTPVSLNLRFLDRDKNMQAMGRSQEEILADMVRLFDEWLPTDPRYVNPYYARLREDPRRLFTERKQAHACDWLWRGCIIAVDGDVMPCCGAFAQSERLGNVLERPLSALWNSPAYQAARRAYAMGEINESVCSQCCGMLL